MRDKLGTAKSIQEMKEICQTLKERTQVCVCHGTTYYYQHPAITDR